MTYYQRIVLLLCLSVLAGILFEGTIAQAFQSKTQCKASVACNEASSEDNAIYCWYYQSSGGNCYLCQGAMTQGTMCMQTANPPAKCNLGSSPVSCGRQYAGTCTGSGSEAYCNPPQSSNGSCSVANCTNPS